MGVRRAVELALDAANKRQGPIYTYGPLIHNPQVLDLLREKGISALDEIPAHARALSLSVPMAFHRNQRMPSKWRVSR